MTPVVSVNGMSYALTLKKHVITTTGCPLVGPVILGEGGSTGLVAGKYLAEAIDAVL